MTARWLWNKLKFVPPLVAVDEFMIWRDRLVHIYKGTYIGLGHSLISRAVPGGWHAATSALESLKA